MSTTAHRRLISEDPTTVVLAPFACDFPARAVGQSLLVHADCFDWLAAIPAQSLSAIVTDPPYTVKEYEHGELQKRAAGRGGIWRIPPAFDGHERAPLPRFTALTGKERATLRAFFVDWARLAIRALRPGGHVIVASNAFISQLTFEALVAGGLEWRGELIRLVQTLRGGSRPKNAEQEFPGVCSMVRGGYEPWGILRAPLPPGMQVAECLRTYGTGGLRRDWQGRQALDVLVSERTPRAERDIADHPSLKPQSFLRQAVYLSLPVDEGIVCDPFMGSASTIAACEAVGYRGIGVERRAEYYALACRVAPALARVPVRDRPWRERRGA